MLVLDTTAVSDIMHRKPEALDRLRDLKPRDVILSAPVLAEIRFGLERLDPRSRRRQLLEVELQRLHDVIGWADWDQESAGLFGSIKSDLQARGKPIDDMDLVIASIALSLGAAVATSNVRHFERIPGLSIEVWS